MAVTITPHGTRPQLPSADNEVAPAGVDVIGSQTGDAVAVADASVSAAFAASGLYRVKATSKCTVRFGAAGLANATGGEPWYDGDQEVRYIAAGEVVAVDTLA